MQLEFGHFKESIPEINDNDIRPAIKDATLKYLQTDPFKDRPDKTQSQKLFEEIWHERKIVALKPPSRKSHKSRGDGDTDYYENIIKDWNRANVSQRGDKRLAWAVFYYFFRYVQETTFFVLIAEKTWPTTSETFMRFVYAKCGGALDDSYQQILERYYGEFAEVELGFRNCWVSLNYQAHIPKLEEARLISKPEQTATNCEKAFWGLKLDVGNTVPMLSEMYSFELLDRQRPRSGGDVDVCLKVSVDPTPDEDGYYFGFGELAVQLEIKPNDVGRVFFNSYFARERLIGENCKVELKGSDWRARMVFRSNTGGYLEGRFELDDEEYYFKIASIDQPIEFGAKLKFNKNKKSLVDIEGREISSDTKRALISLIENEKYAESDNILGWLVLSVQNYSVVPMETASREL